MQVNSKSKTKFQHCKDISIFFRTGWLLSILWLLEVWLLDWSVRIFTRFLSIFMLFWISKLDVFFSVSVFLRNFNVYSSGWTKMKWTYHAEIIYQPTHSASVFRTGGGRTCVLGIVFQKLFFSGSFFRGSFSRYSKRFSRQ